MRENGGLLVMTYDPNMLSSVYLPIPKSGAKAQAKEISQTRRIIEAAFWKDSGVPPMPLTITL